MLCGRCCVTEARSRPALQLDIFIEILLLTSVNKPPRTKFDALLDALLVTRRLPRATPLLRRWFALRSGYRS
jgi:hypothetical protein